MALRVTKANADDSVRHFERLAEDGKPDAGILLRYRRNRSGLIKLTRAVDACHGAHMRPAR
jgi:hypothetical protein